jgi:hypothetical protein
VTKHTLVGQGPTEQEAVANLEYRAQYLWDRGMRPASDVVYWSNNGTIYAAQRYQAPMRAMLAEVLKATRS